MKKVLIADDEARMRKLVGDFLKKRRVFCGRSGGWKRGYR